MTTSVLVPFYVYPDMTLANSQWQQLAQLAIAYPTIEIWAVVNPASGPGTVADTNYVSGIQLLQRAGVNILGYVATTYAKKAVAAVEVEVAAWKSLYNIEDIFFDEVENTVSQSYYWQLASGVRSSFMAKVFGNPGIPIPVSYVGIFDTTVIYEGNQLPFPPVQGYDKKNFAFLLYGQNIPSLPFGYENYGYVYVTSGIQPNPYNGIPYLQQLLAVLL